jgi:hypothetical protein
MVELRTEIGRRPLAKTGDHVHQHPERWPGAQQGKRLGRPRYVLDGRHRIAVARALGERSIPATITEVRLTHPGVSAITSQASSRGSQPRHRGAG